MTASLTVATTGADAGAGSAEHREALLARARRLIAAVEAADGASPVSDQAVLAAAQGKRELLLFGEAGSGSAPGAAEAAGADVAVGIVGEGELDLAVAPAARERGVASAALAELLARADGDLLAWVHGARPRAEALLADAGFAPVRTLHRMALDPKRLPAGVDPLALPVPEGLRLRAFDPARPGDAEAWVAANAAAFADHPEQGRMTVADLELLRREPWFAADDLLVLERADGSFAGSTWVKTVRGEDGAVETELYAVGVRPEHAGQGLGRLLLGATLARMAQHAPDRVSLYVDGGNARAVRMYEAAGFTIDSSSRQWKRPTGGAADARMDP